MAMSDERTRLLEEDVLEHHDATSRMCPNTSVATPIKWRPMLVLLALNAMQPLAFEVVFPFVNQMILEIGVVTDPERVGFYSGLIESIYSCMSFIAILPFSVLADSIGRKPVILGGMLGLALSVSSFGMSKSFSAMVITRCLGGTMGAVWACSRIVIGEMTDKSSQIAAFSALTVAYRTGQIIGLPLGGLLAHPERNFSWFKTPFWYEYPFALPCFVASGLCLCTVAMGYVSLPETLKSKQKYQHQEEPTTDSPDDIDTLTPIPVLGGPQGGPPKQTYRSMLTPTILSLLFSNLAMCLASETIFSVFPLFCFTPVSSGGLGMSEAAIGTQMGLRALLHIGIMGFFSPLERRFGSVRVYQLAMATWPILAICFPLLNLTARLDKTHEWPVMVGLFCFFLVWSISSFAWTAMSIIVNDFAPSAATLSALNGMSQMAIVLSQAISPALATSIFAVSIKSGIVGGNMIWIILFCLTCGAAAHSLTLRESTTDWRRRENVGE